MTQMMIPAECPDLESSTDAYAGRFSGGVGAYFLEVQWNIVRSMLPPANNCRVLDIGGGHAQLTPPMLRDGYDVTVLGSDDSCVQRLDRATDGYNYEFAVGDLLDLPFHENSFDVVLAFRLLPHLQNWNRFLQEICRVAKGCVIFDYPDLRSVNSVSGSLFKLKQRVETNTRRFQCFRKRQLAEALRHYQFHVSQAMGQFVLPMAFHRAMGSETISRSVETIAKSFGLTGWFGSPVILKAECSE